MWWAIFFQSKASSQLFFYGYMYFLDIHASHCVCPSFLVWCIFFSREMVGAVGPLQERYLVTEYVL